MSESTSERHARETLQNKGFVVKRIQCGATRTADYRVADGTSTCLVDGVDRIRERGAVVPDKATEPAPPTPVVPENEDPAIAEMVRCAQGEGAGRPRASDHGHTERGSR
jgi:hypothetical protein